MAINRSRLRRLCFDGLELGSNDDAGSSAREGSLYKTDWGWCRQSNKGHYNMDITIIMRGLIAMDMLKYAEMQAVI